MPSLPPKESYQHPDPLLRRLRLRDAWGKTVDLRTTFRDAEVVCFLFGATWPGSSNKDFIVRSPLQPGSLSFALINTRPVPDRRRVLQTTHAQTEGEHQLEPRHEALSCSSPLATQVIYCSCDTSVQAYEANTKGKNWLSMEYGAPCVLRFEAFEAEPPSTTSTAPVHTATYEEPFLLATDPDLEETVHDSDPTGSLYLRPYSRVYLAEKFSVLSVPSLVAYHVEKRAVIDQHVRFDSLKGEKGAETWAKWQKGESNGWDMYEIVDKLKWSLGFGVVAIGYVLAVRVGGAEDVVQKFTASLTKAYLSG
ncbi:hypothetical protein P7C70_g5549, partial [Phenoliferia sp. Uapishka_3]